MKVMRSNREGSKCTDCGTEIKIGDAIAYFGPQNVYGLECHENEKTRRYLTRLLNEENGREVVKEVTRTGSANQSPHGNSRIDSAQEWVCRIGWREGLVTDQLQMELAKWLLKGRYCGQLIGSLNILEFRAPRGVGIAATKAWAEGVAKEWPQELGSAEAAPMYLEGGLKEVKHG